MSYNTERLIKNARTALPGALDSVIQIELFNVLDEFLSDSSIWQEEIPFTVAAADPAGTVYYIEPESVSTIVRLMRVVSPTGRPVYGFMQVPGEITFPVPLGENGTFMSTVALTIDDPTQKDGYPEYPSWIETKYRIGLLNGVLARMMAQPAKPYTNVKMAEYYLKRFRNAVATASIESDHTNVFGRQAWTFPQSFATRRR